MICQTYITCDEYSLFACVYSSEIYENIAILFPGFSHSKSDMDYLLSNVRNELVNNDYLVIQVDYYGHGDSCGDFVESNIDVLRKDILSVLKWAESEFNGTIALFCRGIVGNIISHTEMSDRITKKVILNPLYIDNKDILNLSDILITPDYQDEFEFYDYYENLNDLNKKNIGTFMYGLGIELRNILGMKIKTSTLTHMLNLTHLDSNVKNNCIFLISNELKKIEACYDITEFPLSHYENCFIRDPEWNDLIVKAVVDCIRKV